MDEAAEDNRFPLLNFDGFVKNPVLVIARSSAFAGRRSNLVFSGTCKNEVASLALAMTLSWLFTSPSILNTGG